MAETITIRGKWTVEELAKYLEKTQKINPFPWKQFFSFLFLFSISVAFLIAYFLDDKKDPKSDPLGLLLLSVLFFVVCAVFSPKVLAPHFHARFFKYHFFCRRAKKTLRENPSMSQESVITLGDDFISYTDLEKEWRFKWEAVRKYEKTQDYICLPEINLNIQRVFVKDDLIWQSIQNFINLKIDNS